MSAEGAVYLDSSAIVKLVIAEDESGALTDHLRRYPTRVSCGLARVEVVRAVRPHGAGAVTRARRLLERLGSVALDEVLLDDAADLGDAGLRSLDAIHIAAARAIGNDLSELITYDRRMAEAAEALALRTSAPGAAR